MPESLYRHPTRSEIIELAAAEGHDADIPTNAGSINDFTAPPIKPRSSSMDFEKDVEKGNAASLTSVEESGSGSEAAPDDEEHQDPHIVFWDGPDDPQNPMNWSANKKWGTVTVVSCITFLTPLASSSFAPGVPKVMETFKSTNDMLEGFMVSVYVLGFAFGPLIFAPLSEMYGRLPLYHTCNVFFIIFSIAAAVASNMTMFIVFRFFMGCECCPVIIFEPVKLTVCV